MAVPADLTLADFYITAAGLVWRDAEDGATPVKLPAAPLTWLLMYRAGIAVEDIAMAAGRQRADVLKGLDVVLSLQKFPSVAQKITALQKEMPRLQLEDVGEILVFPGPSTVTTAVSVPA